MPRVRKPPEDPALALVRGEGLSVFLLDDQAWALACAQLKEQLCRRLGSLDRTEARALLLLRCELIWTSALKSDDRVAALQSIRLMAQLCELN